jgi:hypothetical protein
MGQIGRAGSVVLFSFFCCKTHPCIPGHMLDCAPSTFAGKRKALPSAATVVRLDGISFGKDKFPPPVLVGGLVLAHSLASPGTCAFETWALIKLPKVIHGFRSE